VEDPILHVKALIETTSGYLRTTTELYKLKAIEKVANIVSTLATKTVLIPMIILFFLTINIAVGLWLGEWLGKMSYGFFAVAGLYGVIGLLIFLLGNKLIKNPIRNIIIKNASKINLPWEVPETTKN
jgi:hypothetical protein